MEVVTRVRRTARRLLDDQIAIAFTVTLALTRGLSAQDAERLGSTAAG
jgi:hypothetical protein